MAVRTTKDDVRGIMEDALSDINDTDLDRYITSANRAVNAIIGTGTSDILTEIEMWLTAHMVAVSRLRQSKKEEAGGASIEYTGYWRLGLEGTSYGQMVLSLDTTGNMASSYKKSASITAITSFD